jgi:Uma2 family endonuclease
VALVIEVADSSLVRDQIDKARLYARAGISSYWVVNLLDRRVEAHTRPSGPCDSPAYASVVHYSPAEAVPLVLDGVAATSVPAGELLP